MRIHTGSRRRRQSGLSLVEVMISTSIGGFMVAALAVLTFFSGRSFAALTNYVELDAYSRNALDLMTRDIRQANRLTSYSTNQLIFSTPGGTLTFAYNSTAKQLTRTKTGEPNLVLLKECDFLQFSIYQRNTVASTFDQYAVATPDTCKVVQLSWICSRSILKQKANSESVQSAKIVMRKQ